MSEKIRLNEEEVGELERTIKLNAFLDVNLEGGSVEAFGTNDLLPATDYEKEKALSEERDVFLEKFSVADILEASLKDASFVIDKNGNIEITHNQQALEILAGYGYKGGAARSVLRKVLGLKDIPPRDFDVVRLGAEPYAGADNEVAKKFMAHDFEFGDGVEVVDNPNEYLETRDFTINEVYTNGDKIIATQQCIKDTVRNVIRTTAYERKLFSGNGDMGPKMKAKTLRLHAEQMYALGVSSIPEDDLNVIEGTFINPFWLAVQLDRAFERGTAVAENFTTLLYECKIVPEYVRTSTDLGDYLLTEVDGFRFRNAPHLQYKFEEDHKEDEAGLQQADLLEDYFDTVYHGCKY